MSSEMINDKKERAKTRRAFRHAARSRGLKKNWFTALVVLWIVIWGFVGTSGIIPRPLWVVILALLLLSALAIALFGPRIGGQKTH